MSVEVAALGTMLAVWFAPMRPRIAQSDAPRIVSAADLQVNSVDLATARRRARPWPKVNVLRGLQMTGFASGDFDGDCAEDIAVAVEVREDEFDFAPPRFIWLFRGRDWSFLAEIEGGNWLEHEAGFGTTMARAGDVDAENCEDLVVGLPYSLPVGWIDEDYRSYARVYSGRTGSLLVQQTSVGDCSDGFGLSVCGLGDLDGDGRGEWCAGVPARACGGPARARVFSGTSGVCLRELVAADAESDFGWAVASAGDVNADGSCDVWVASVEPGQLACFSGADGGLLHQVAPEQYALREGTQLFPAGDVDGDGVPDLLVNGGHDWREPARVLLVSGADGRVARRFEAPADLPGVQNFGCGFASTCGDLNGDGIEDVAVHAGSVLLLHSGRDGSLLAVIVEPRAPTGFTQVASLGDHLVTVSGGFPNRRVVVLDPRLALTGQ